MEDSEIIDLYFNRSEAAISETRLKYGKYCYAIAYRILDSELDAEECVDDAYLSVWGLIPPQRPVCLKAFLGKITRNIALNRYDHNNAAKRSSKFEVIIDEYFECTHGGSVFDSDIEIKELINNFLSTLSKRNRNIFLQRY